MAVRLGRVNVDAMLRSLTAKQFVEWEAYARLEPFNELRDDARIAQLTAVLANVNRDPKRRPKAYTIEDFMLKFEAEKKMQQKWPDQLAVAYAICAGYDQLSKELT